jgi:hypothetical protein
VADRSVTSIGSVGFPFDLDPRAAYALARWQDGRWTVEHRRVAYDHEAVARQLEMSDIPFATRYATMIRQAKWLPRPKVES